MPRTTVTGVKSPAQLALERVAVFRASLVDVSEIVTHFNGAAGEAVNRLMKLTGEKDPHAELFLKAESYANPDYLTQTAQVVLDEVVRVLTPLGVVVKTTPKVVLEKKKRQYRRKAVKEAEATQLPLEASSAAVVAAKPKKSGRWGFYPHAIALYKKVLAGDNLPETLAEAVSQAGLAKAKIFVLGKKPRVSRTVLEDIKLGDNGVFVPALRKAYQVLELVAMGSKDYAPVVYNLYGLVDFRKRKDLIRQTLIKWGVTGL